MTFEPITIRLAGEPKGKGRPRFSRGGHAFTPADTRKHEAALRYAAQQVMGERAPIADAVFMTVVATLAVPASWSKRDRAAALAGDIWPTKKPDADNVLKLVADACNEIVVVDDKQIVDARIRKVYGERPELWIFIEPAVNAKQVVEAIRDMASATLAGIGAVDLPRGSKAASYHLEASP